MLAVGSVPRSPPPSCAYLSHAFFLRRADVRLFFRFSTKILFDYQFSSGCPVPAVRFDGASAGEERFPPGDGAHGFLSLLLSSRTFAVLLNGGLEETGLALIALPSFGLFTRFFMG